MAAEVTVHDFCPVCDEELSITVGLRAPDLGTGPIDYCEVVGQWTDRCHRCGTRLPPDLFTRAAELALEIERQGY